MPGQPLLHSPLVGVVSKNATTCHTPESKTGNWQSRAGQDRTGQNRTNRVAFGRDGRQGDREVAWGAAWRTKTGPESATGSCKREGNGNFFLHLISLGISGAEKVVRHVCQNSASCKDDEQSRAR